MRFWKSSLQCMASLMIFNIISRFNLPCIFREANIVLVKESWHLIYGLLHTTFICMVSFITIGLLSLVKAMVFFLLRSRGFICWIKLFFRFKFSVPLLLPFLLPPCLRIICLTNQERFICGDSDCSHLYQLVLFLY